MECLLQLSSNRAFAEVWRHWKARSMGFSVHNNDCCCNLRHDSVRRFDRSKKKLTVMRNPIEKCQVCGLFREVFIEHDKRTGFIRGFACRSCNNLISYLEQGNMPFKSKHTGFGEKLVKYLENPPFAHLHIPYDKQQ